MCRHCGGRHGGEADKHYYQPLWTLVGAGIFGRTASVREEASVIQRGAVWIKDAVTEFIPEENAVLTQGGRRVGYDYLVVAPGIQVDWDRVKGLREALTRGNVGSNYDYDHVEKTRQAIRSFRGGTALFTHPATAVKCAGAPQKIMYLAEEYFRRSGVRSKAKVRFMSGQGEIFKVQRYADTLNSLIAQRDIETVFKQNLVEIRPDQQEAVFQHVETGETTVIHYDLLHVTPPMSAPDFVKRSPLADSAGWVDVDKHTLRHVRFPNVFGLGDAANLPTSKTGAAIRKQAPVLVKNLVAALNGEGPSARYDGYTSCPLVVGYNRLVLAEFDYDHVPRETFPVDQSKPRLSMYLLKKYVLPAFYWHGMLKGLS